MKVVGLYLVRNEVDIIEVNLRHHLDTVIDEAIVIDNGSTDGTLEILHELKRDLPIDVTSEPGAFAQAILVTGMARQAASQGAAWVLPIDADELWTSARGSVREHLAESKPDVAVLECDVINFVQRRDQLWRTTSGLLGVTGRAIARGDEETARRRVESGEIAFVEIPYPKKCISRADPNMAIEAGNHRVEGVSGRQFEHPDIICLHAPLRARSLLTMKVDQGRRVEETNAAPDVAWHVRRWWRVAYSEGIEAEWAANSYLDGALALESTSHEVVHDERFRDLVEPWVKQIGDRSPSVAETLPPLIGAYLLGLDTVPGWFSEVDFRILVELDRLQGLQGVRGDLFEIGAYCGKSAILLAYLVRENEKLTVCDVFGGSERVTDANAEENSRWYPEFTQEDFEYHFLRFHPILPELVIGPSTGIDCNSRIRSCRIIHIDGSHVHSIVKADIVTARSLMTTGGVVALDDISTAHNPGSALAAWEAVLEGTLFPICLTDAKLYATFEPVHAAWAVALEAWAEAQDNLLVERHELAGHIVPRIVASPLNQGRTAIGAANDLDLEVDRSCLNGEPAREAAPLTSGERYDADFYDFAAHAARSSAEEIVPVLVELTGARSVIDVGCGTGTWLSVFEANGVCDAVGVDGDHVELSRLEIRRSKFVSWNLENPLPVRRSFDLAICLEVAEHLTESRGETLVDELLNLAPLVLFSAALPLQGGVGHINEQWPSYWVGKFKARGALPLDIVRPAFWGNDRVAMWYAQNCLLFARNEAMAANEALASASKSTAQLPFDVVHPSLFLYHRLGIVEPTARVPLEAFRSLIDTELNRPQPPPTDPIAIQPQTGGHTESEPWARGDTESELLGLRALLEQLPMATRRAARSRWSRLSRGSS